jgi:hypothetical protein
MNMNQKSNQKNLSGIAGVSLYLRVHVMPKLNMPLRGRAWQWISPFAAAAVLIVAIFYFLSD